VNNKKYIDDIIGLPNNNVIYCLCDPITEQIRYIGKTVNLYDRIKKHYKNSELKNKTHKNMWILSLLKNNFRAKVLVLEECNNLEQLNNAEIKWIKFYKEIGSDLTNGTNGGTGGKMSLESIEKMRNSKRGKKLSEEHKKQISEGNKGRQFSEETKRKIGNSNKGKIISEETKIKLSISHMGKVSCNKGKSLSSETKIKMRESRFRFLNNKKINK
jgi:group I intron endonuclease